MSNLEVAYQAQPYARYMVASEESEPNNGWPYDTVLRQLVDHPDLPTADLAAHMVNAYTKSYVDSGYAGAVTQSAFDLARVDRLAASLDRLADALIGAMPDAATSIWAAQRKSARFWHNTLWDLCHFCEELERLFDPASAVYRAAQEVRTALQAGPDQFIVAESHNGDKVGAVAVSRSICFRR